MDPDEALDRLRNAVNDYGAATSLSMEADAAERIVEHFTALDEWLTRGGFPPGAWVAEADAVAP